MVRIPLFIYISFLIYTTEFIINKQTARPLKCLHLSEENMVSGLYLDQDSGEKLADEEPAVWNIHFFLFKRVLIRVLADDGRWKTEVVLDRYKDLQDPVLGWMVMQRLISRMILLPLNTPNSSSQSLWLHY
jgi:hypothetical protein